MEETGTVETTSEDVSIDANASGGDISDMLTPEFLAQAGIDIGDSKESGQGKRQPASDDDLLPEDVMKLLSGDEEEGEEDKSTEETAETPESLFEITHDKQVHKLTKEAMTEMAQKGFDYTQKTQALAQERADAEAQLTSEFEALQNDRTSFDGDIRLKQQWDFCMDTMKSDDPVLFEQIQDYFQQTSRHFSNPVMDAQIQRLTQEIENLKGQTTKQEDKRILDDFNVEINSVKAKHQPNLDALGLTVDWDGKIKTAWANGAETVEKALFAAYGADMIKLYQSKGKLADVKNKAKSSNKVLNAKSIGRGGVSYEKADLSKMSYSDIAQRLGNMFSN